MNVCSCIVSKDDGFDECTLKLFYRVKLQKVGYLCI